MDFRISDLIERLKASPEVLGIVRYGSRTIQDNSKGGDFDLFVIVQMRDPDLESIHFYWGQTPVDLGLRTLHDLEQEKPLSYIDPGLADGEILFDRTGTLQELVGAAADRWTEPINPLPESEVVLTRFYQQHVLEKVKGRIEADPVFCNMLLSINITWLLHIYYKVRYKKFPGEKVALDWIRRKEPDIAAKIEAFFETTSLKLKLSLSEKLTDLVLEPIGGPWERAEVLGFGVDSKGTNLKTKAEEAFSRLLGMSPGEAG